MRVAARLYESVDFEIKSVLRPVQSGAHFNKSCCTGGSANNPAGVEAGMAS